MKKILILTLAICILPGVVLAQETGSESIRARLEQARQAKNEKLDNISLQSELMRSALMSSRPAPLVSQPVMKLHPALLSLPGRVVTNVLTPVPALQKPDLPLVTAKTLDRTGNI